NSQNINDVTHSLLAFRHNIQHLLPCFLLFLTTELFSFMSEGIHLPLSFPFLFKDLKHISNLFSGIMADPALFLCSTLFSSEKRVPSSIVIDCIIISSWVCHYGGR